jgi:putative N6-adenine-specific DNA methylase
VILCNPPYGQRIGAAKELRGLYKLLGDVLRERCAGWTAFVFSGNPALDEAIGLTPTSGIPLYNGRIPCRLLRYDLAGGRSEPAV